MKSVCQPGAAKGLVRAAGSARRAVTCGDDTGKALLAGERVFVFSSSLLQPSAHKKAGKMATLDEQKKCVLPFLQVGM